MIYELLEQGEQNARSGSSLAAFLGCSVRDITAQVERERRQGHPICASSREYKGYYLAADAEELEIYCNRLRHRAAELYKTRGALLEVLTKIRDNKEAAEHGKNSE